MNAKRLAAVAAALATLLVPASALGQAGEPSPSDSDGGTEYRVPMQTQTVYAVLELKPGERSIALYRSLIPRGYAMPARPHVAVYLTEPNIPRKIPGQPYNEYSRWIEGPLSIRVRFGSEEGYFPIVMPVTSKFEYDLGRAAGLPKVLVDGGMEPTPEGARVRTTVAGKTAVDLNFRRAPLPVTDELDAFARNKTKLFALFPALKGPDLFFTKFIADPVTPNNGTAPVPPPFISTEPEPGFVDYDISPDLDGLDDTLPDLFKARGASLADLVEPRGTVTGLFWDLPQILRLRSGKIGTGGGYGEPGSLPANRPPAATSSTLGLPSTRKCQSRRRFVIRVRGLRGQRVRTLRVSINGRRVRTLRGRSARAPVDLRGLPRGRFRVTVVAITHERRTITERRIYRTCVKR